MIDRSIRSPFFAPCRMRPGNPVAIPVSPLSQESHTPFAVNRVCVPQSKQARLLGLFRNVSGEPLSRFPGWVIQGINVDRLPSGRADDHRAAHTRVCERPPVTVVTLVTVLAIILWITAKRPIQSSRSHS